ncbi:DUF4335 domain-containing protein [Nostoc sp. FACHB-110]|uniref:DUF4335 domain-containing protein n=1 Tax=Nostoc sp. FACHB-110 TaxID=2692834 RepID=UPI001681D4C1|nr:DUF4335 domain-containing protein [Nostoc sp. FACHB-110]MBD2438611.1 DUF4335 domain-containing protein [Nostoc sp. FACHB-110]
MPLSNSVIRRYTPPTCTLEVLAQSSPLSRWMGKTVIKQLSFELRLDDPRLPEERRVIIRGDRDQLEALCDAVTSYVQQYLQQSPESFRMSFSGPQDSTKASYDLALSDVQPSSLSTTQAFNSFTSVVPKSKIYLEPGNYLTHKLHLGSLATPTSGHVIQLSLLQIFDLATALDEYSTDVMALPNLNNTNSVLRFPTWAPVAAVLVLSVGLLPLTLQYANNHRQQQQQVAKKEVPQAPSELALQPSPAATLAPTDNLATLPPIGSTLPLPTSSLPAQPIIPNLNLPTAQTSSALPPVGSKNLLTIPQTAITNPKNNQRTTASTTIPGQQIALNPNLKFNSGQSAIQAEDLPQRRSLPPRLSANNNNLTSTIPVIPPSFSNPITNNNQRNNLPAKSSPTEQELVGKLNASAANSSPEINPAVDRLGEEPKAFTPANVATNSTLFDTTQVAEARSFFQKHWQPPSGLTQTLEYSLSVDVDGTITRILPLNKPAREFIDNTGMPAIGKPFVSANRSGQNVKIRVVLSPDGKVQTLPESE